MLKLKIEGLFGTHNIEIDLSKKCVLILGENGVGKSTTLRILSLLMDGDFYGLTRYPFKKILLKGSRKSVTFSFSDLFPVKEEFSSLLSSWYNLNFDMPLITFKAAEKSNVDYYGLIDNNVNINDIIKEKSLREFIKYLSEIDSYDYCLYLSSLLWEYNLSSKFSDTHKYNLLHTDIIRFLKSLIYDKCFLLSPICQDSYYKEIRSDVKELFSLTKTDANSTDSFCSQYSSQFSALYYSSTFNYELTNDFYIEFQPHSPDLEYDKIIFADGYNFSEIIRKNNSIKEDIYSKIPKGILPLASVIADNYFSIQDIIKINKKAFDFYKMFLHEGIESKEIKGSNNDIRGFFAHNRAEIENYILPILSKNSLYDHFVNMIYKNDIYNYDFNSIDISFIEFYSVNINWIKSLISSKIKLYEKVLNMFLFNKKIEVTPRGLIIKNSANQEIDISLLSSGEKKIITLITLALFFDNSILLIDEPEISMSIIWQSMLVPTLLKIAKLKKIVVASHSPYIAEDESLHKYLQPIYTEIIGDYNE